MNKIIQANINGFVFQIDELAYVKLKAYLDVIKQKVSNTEVVQDIENRIAELFNEKLVNEKIAIFDNDVDEVMQQIGKPEEFGTVDQDDQEKSTEQNAYSDGSKAKRRLYRDADDKVIGGVCSGIAAYFGLDPALVRIGFAIALFFFGAGVVFYILLMVILPKAVTPSEKLEMRGEPVDYKNLSRTVELEFKEAYQRYKPEMKTGVERFIEILVRVGMVILAVLLLSIVIPSSFGVLTGIGLASWTLPTLNSYMFTTQSESIIILIGLFLFVLIPFIGIIYSVLRFAFKIRPMNKVFSIGLSILWFIGFCMLGWSTYTIGQQFSSSYKITGSDTLKFKQNNLNTLVLRTNASQNHSRFLIKDEDGERHIHIRSQEDMKDAIDQEISEQVRLRIVQGFNTTPVVTITRSSKGRSSKDAQYSASNIEYRYDLRDTVLYLDETFGRGEQTLWRNQKVLVTIEVPLHYRLFIDKSCQSILHMDWSDEKDILGRYLRVDHRGVQVGE